MYVLRRREEVHVVPLVGDLPGLHDLLIGDLARVCKPRGRIMTHRNPLIT